MREDTLTVHNINRTSERSCNCGSWLEHWEKFSGRPLPEYCPESSCSQKPAVGVLVQKDNSSDSNRYIVPLCKKHSAETGKSLHIFDIPLVSANVGSTCGA